MAVAVGLLTRGNKVLFAERPFPKPYHGYWELPGGKLSENEAPYAALIRELYEELGIVVNEAVFLFNHKHDYPDQSILLQVYHVRAFQGEPKGCEGQALKWLSLSQLSTVNLLPANGPLLARYQDLLS